MSDLFHWQYLRLHVYNIIQNDRILIVCHSGILAESSENYSTRRAVQSRFPNNLATMSLKICTCNFTATTRGIISEVNELQ